MRQLVQKMFADHPNSVDETYFQHMRFALRFSLALFLAAGAALVHAIVPGLCEKSASQKICTLYDQIKNRG